MTEQDLHVRRRLSAAIDDLELDVDDTFDDLRTHRPVGPRRRAVTLVVALAIAVGGLALGGWLFSRNSAVPGSGGGPEAILFERYSQDVEAPTEIWSVGIDGLNAHPLPQPHGTNTKPVWSPDGTKIAFVHADGDGRTELWVMNADGTGAVQLAQDFAVDQPDWSPDGELIAFLGARDPYQPSHTGIHVVPVDGGEPRLVLQGLDWEEPKWSPDGSRLAVLGFDGATETFDLYLARPDGSDLTRLTNDAWDYANSAWSPDGDLIAVARYSDDRRPDIYVMAADGTGLRQLTRQPGWDSSPIWSDGGSQILYASEGGEPGSYGAADLAIYVMNSDGSDPRLVYQPAGEIATATSWLR